MACTQGRCERSRSGDGWRAALLVVAAAGSGCGVVVSPTSADASEVDVSVAPDPALDALGSDAELRGWRPTRPLPAPLYAHAAVAYERHVFVIGGDVGGNVQTDAVWSAPVLNDGQLGTWTSQPALSGLRASLVSVEANGYLYVLGGANEAVGQVADVQYAHLGADGVVGPWRTAPALPSPRMNFAAAVAGDRLYVVAGNYGEAGVNWRDVLTASLTPDGSIGGWRTVATLPSERETHAVFASGGRLYIAGGHTMQHGFVREVLSAAILGDGQLSAWRAEASLPVAAGYWATARAADLVYLTGGSSDNGRAVELVLAARPAGDGAIAGWTALEPLPSPRFSVASVTVDGRLYVLGGRQSGVGVVPTSEVFVMSPDAALVP